LVSEITLSLPDDVMRRAEVWAQRAGRPIAEVLADAIAQSLNPLGTPVEKELALSGWSDAEVLAGAETQMPPAEDERLSLLLDRQQADLLTSAERTELAALMQRYQEGLLHKARSLREAVRRGLRPPLES
jgi:hypothetical protein